MLYMINRYPRAVEGVLTNIPAIVTMPVQKAVNARVIITMTKKVEVKDVLGIKRRGEIIFGFGQRLVQGKGHLCRPLVVAREEKNAKSYGEWEFALMEFVLFLRCPLSDGR